MSNSLLDPVVGYFVGLQTLVLDMEKILLVVLTEMKQEIKILGVPRFSALQWSLETAFSIELDEQIVEFALPDHVFLIDFNAWTINNSGVRDRI